MRAWLCAALSILLPAAGYPAERAGIAPPAAPAPLGPIVEMPGASVSRTAALAPGEPGSPAPRVAPEGRIAGTPAPLPQAQLAAAIGQRPRGEQEQESVDAVRRRLFDGERVYAPEAPYQTLDDKTVNDLDLMTSGSGLHALVSEKKATTAFGQKRLQWVLTHPSQDLAEIHRRQEAVAALSGDADLRKAVDAAFSRLGASAGEALREHALSDFAPDKGRLIVAHLLQAFLIGTIVLLATHGGARALAQGAMMFILLAGAPVQLISSMRKQLLPYKSVFALSREVAQPLSRSASPRLRELGRALDVDNAAPDGPGLSSLSGSFKRMGGAGAMGLPDFLWFHGAKTLPYVMARMKARRAELARLFGALGELDALRALSAYGEGLGEAARPVIRDGEAVSLRIEQGHHPLLASRGGSVGNDVRLGQDPGEVRFGVLTGSNMGGKSTYLRMAALLPILAQAGALVPAAAYEATPLKIISSIDIRDHLASGKSLYDAETDRMLGLLGEAQKGGYLMVMDEILQGTNPEESSAAQWAIVRHLTRTKNLFFLATHNPKVTELAGIEPGLSNFHVEESIQDGKMVFSHKVLPGPVTSRNGLLTLEQKGFPKDVVNEARRAVEGAPKP